MSDPGQSPILYALAGAVIGIFLYSKLSSNEEKQKEISEEQREEIKLELEKKDSFHLKKLVMLKAAQKKFEEGLVPQESISFSRVPHLTETHECDVFISPLYGDISKRDALSGGFRGGFLPDEAFSSCNKIVLANKSYTTYKDIARGLKFLRAGPRKEICFNPSEVKAAIVTCGGLCPGLNVVIRELVMTLSFNYGVKTIYGVKWGFHGFHKDESIIELTPQDVKRIHNNGGSFLGSSRGGFDEKVIVRACKERGINQLYIIGGDGTHRGIYRLYEYTSETLDRISICGIPKTIDNDIPLIDKSFGFDTACEVAEKVIDAAN